jgi:hypothetical protein
MKRHRFKQDKAVGERLINEARLARERAHQLPPGAQREDLLRKAREADVAADIDEWLNSPRLKTSTWSKAASVGGLLAREPILNRVSIGCDSAQELKQYLRFTAWCLGSIRLLFHPALAITLRATDDYSFAELCLMFGDYNAAAAASGALDFVFWQAVAFWKRFASLIDKVWNILEQVRPAFSLTGQG